MVEISLTLEVVSPLALHQNRASFQFTPTLDYIPGSALRGALASLYLQGDPSRAHADDFRALFLDVGVLYPDLLPATNPGDPWRLVPATAWACKRFQEDHADSVSDLLLRLGLAETLRSRGRPDWHKPLEDVEDCPVCRGEYPGPSENRPRDRLNSRYAISLDPAFRAGKVRLRLRTGTAVDRATGAVASGMLFSQQVIDSDQLFSGRLRLAEAEAPRLAQLLKDLAPEKAQLYLGYGRSRGMGHVQVTRWQPASATSSLDERWKRFNRAAQRLWERYQAGAPQHLYFSLTLTSHLALRYTGGQPVLGNIRPADLGLPGDWRWRNLEAVAVPGWNMAWGMPKPDTWALQRGSVLLGRIEPTQEAAALARLAELESAGVGDRRAEGFGRVVVCDEFHYTYTLKEL